MPPVGALPDVFQKMTVDDLFAFQNETAVSIGLAIGAKPLELHEAAFLQTSANGLCLACFSASYAAGWYHNHKTNEEIERPVPERLMLMVSELGEAMEGHRKNLQDDKVPQHKMLHAELADAVIRIFDFMGAERRRDSRIDFGQIIVDKMNFNANRADHKLENRAKEGGKVY